MTQPIMTTMPMMNAGRRSELLERLAPRLRSLRTGAATTDGIGGSGPAVTMTSISRSASSRIRGFIQAMTRSAVEGREHVDDADDDGARGQHRDVLALGGEQHRLAHPVVVEDLLDRDDPAEQVADLDGDDRDGRDERVAQDVAAHHLAGGQALHRGRPGVVGLEDVDGARPRHPGDVAEVDDGHRRRGHQQVPDLGRDVGVRRRRREDGQELELDADDDDQDRPGHELGDRGRGHAEEHDRAVRGLSLRRAAYSPARMPSGSVISRARPASLADRTIASRSCGRTGWPVTYDSPKSSVRSRGSSRRIGR